MIEAESCSAADATDCTPPFVFSAAAATVLARSSAALAVAAINCAVSFNSVEADVYLIDGKLLVAHDRKDVKPDRTLESLYLDPLRERIKANGGRVYKDGPTIFLLVDVKTAAEDTYAALDKVLANYADIVSVVKDGKFEAKAVTVVLSGNRAKETVAKQAPNTEPFVSGGALSFGT